MSIQAISWAIEQRTGSPSRKSVLIALANYADKEGRCYPGQQTIAEDAELGVRSVRRCLVELEDAGFISRAHRQRANGSRTSDVYFLEAKLAHRTQSNRPLCPIQPATVSAPIEEPLREPLREPSVKDNTNVLSKKRIFSGKFLEFWKLYPNKTGKEAADVSFKRALKKVSFEEMMAGLERYVNKTDDRAWCNPTTWLNQGRWDDEPAQPIVPQKPNRISPAEMAIEMIRKANNNDRPQTNSGYQPSLSWDATS